MAFVELKQALQTHLLNVAFEVIDSQFGGDPSKLFEESGVNYEHDGKIWNIRIGFQRGDADKVTDVFIRMHSNDGINGYHFSERPSGQIFYQISRVLFNGFINAVQDMKTGQKGYPKDYDAENLDFLEILRSGIRKDDIEIPKLPKKTIDLCSLFFQSCPGLIPPCIDPLPLNPPVDPPPRPQNNNKYFVTAIIVIGLALCYFGYKIFLKDRTARFS